ncbi:hypothetical protein N431DRAFT_477770 [Stipitochalara longipes BDJ]|nr:hypothetical protein N431DRAFT_477770 [Stipitochalara longipes BDJ]
MASPIQGPPPNAAYLTQSRVPEILFGSIFPATIATIFVLARFYSRAILRKNWGWDDFWILLAWLNGGIVLTVLNCVLTRYGAGRHIILLTMPEIAKLDLIGTICRFLYTICLFTTKISICALYLRLFLERKDRIIVWTIVAYHVIFTIPLFFGLVFRCSPIQANWSLVPGRCQPYTPPMYASSVLNICGDLALLAFIVPKLSTLKIRPRQRYILVGVMGMGVLVIIASIVRLIRIVAEVNDAGFDVPFASYDVVIWSSVEVNTGLVCAAAPATMPLFRFIAPCWLSKAPGGALNNTAARRSNYADGRTENYNYQPSDETFELNRQMKRGIGMSASPHSNQTDEPSDIGGLLNVNDKRTGSGRAEVVK